MDHQNVSIGIGNNPDGPDLPIGLSMQLTQEPDAIAGYGRLSKEQQASLIRFIQDAASGDEAQMRIMEVVHRLKEDGAPSPFYS